ncbi:hypothetical protein HBA54_03650 [Pelagibius litoralis]|uniref:Uncharacterized protein n=1 Tax=Pelagibius litoralis TaxID=374515 RepID=A0A967C3A5_9PROT|nr:hypothetical protein [Pelagibius litoralis]NIA67675.1 hypothetical protein [Pelagibius litoralis]
MTPEELTERHPKLFHVTEPGTHRSIREHGLLSTAEILTLFEVEAKERERLMTARRATAISLRHPRHGSAVLNDNLPLSEKALETCLDDGLTPADWLRILNSKVFFWADEAGLQRLLGARMNQGRQREVLVFDTLRVAEAHLDTLCLCPINSGATIRKAARRGLSTFTAAKAHSYAQWRKLRGRSDKVVEITVDHAVPRAGEFLTDVRLVP